VRRSWLVVSAIVGLGACTLIDQPTSYFDPEQGPGSIVTLAAVTTEAVKALALTTNAVVYATSDAVFRVPKSGGNVESLAMFDGGDLVALASDGQSRVAWCSTSIGITTWDDATSTPTLIADSESCETLAISADRLVYTIANANSDGTTARFVNYQSTDGAVSPSGGFPLSVGEVTRSALALTTSDVYYVTQGGALAREILPTDLSGSPVGAPACWLGVGGSDPSAVLVGTSGDADVAMMASTDTDIMSATGQSRCCDPLADGGAAACPPMTHWISVYTGRIATYADSGALWWITDEALLRFQLTDLLGEEAPLAALGGLDGGTPLRDDLTSAINLAVDDTYAFFTSYNQTSRFFQVQRLQLTP
jgi:hypothetical protein